MYIAPPSGNLADVLEITLYKKYNFLWIKNCYTILNTSNIKDIHLLTTWIRLFTPECCWMYFIRLFKFPITNCIDLKFR